MAEDVGILGLKGKDRPAVGKNGIYFSVLCTLMLPIGHFALGYCIVMAVLLLTRTYRFVLRDGALAALGGLLAMLPDAPYVFLGEHASWHDSPIMNIFFFHQWFDVLLRDDYLVFPAILIAIAVLLTGVLWMVDKDHSKVIEK